MTSENISGKGILHLLIMVTLLFAGGWACSSTKQSAGTESASGADEELTERLKSIGGIRVNGTGEYAEVVAKGGKADEHPRYMKPIFVINGSTVNYDFYTLYQVLSNRKILQIKLLKGPEANLYNHSSGVPVISFKTGD